MQQSRLGKALPLRIGHAASVSQEKGLENRSSAVARNVPTDLPPNMPPDGYDRRLHHPPLVPSHPHIARRPHVHYAADAAPGEISPVVKPTGIPLPLGLAEHAL
jgi:hypothetical protein